MRFVAIVLALAAVRPAVAQVEIRWKWRNDDTFYVQTVTKVNQTLIIEDPRASVARAAGFMAALNVPLEAVSLSVVMTLSPPIALRDRPLNQHYEHLSVVRYNVKKRNDDGSAIVTQQVVKDRGRVKVQTVVKPDPTLDDVELTLHVDARGQVTKVEGNDKLLEKLAGNDTGKRDALRDTLSAEALQASATQALAIMPAKTVKTGDEWSVASEMKLGVLGEAKLHRTFTLKNIQSKGATTLANLSFTSRLTDYRPDPVQIKIAGAVLMQRLPLQCAAVSLSFTVGDAYRITDCYLTESSGKGDLDVDLDAGRLKEATSKVNLHGHLTLRNSEVLYRARLTQEQTITLTVFENLPPK